MTPKCAQKAKELYEILVEGECLLTDVRTAEMAKLTENAFRDVNIAFANELSLVCDKLKVNVWELIELANKHPRVNILQPGPGVGGHCIAVDPWFIVSQAPEEAQLIRTARGVNDSKPQWIQKKIDKSVDRILMENPNWTFKDVTIACFGLSFKPDIDDLRESPALQIANNVANTYPGRVLIVEPNIEQLPKDSLHGAKLVNEYEALDMADIIVLLVDHKQFRKIPTRSICQHYVIDSRGIWQN